MNTTTKVIERDGWKVTLDTTQTIVLAGLSLDFDWITVTLERLAMETAKGLSESDALASINDGGSWAILERTEGK